MKTKTEEIILDTNPNLVEFRNNIEGWVGKDGSFYGKNKDLAIYANSTHKKCDKGHAYRKIWISCPKCKEAELPAKYLRLPEKEWDLETPLCLFDSDTYFFDIDAVFDYANDEEIEVSNLDLVICVPNHLWQIETDTWVDIFPEDFEDRDVMSKEFLKKLKELNEIIDNHSPVSWNAGGFRTRVRHK